MRACAASACRLRDAEHQRRSSKQPKGGQVVLFLCTFSFPLPPPAPPQHLSNRVNIHKHVNWRTGALIKARAHAGAGGGGRARARANQLSTTWGHLSFAPCATGGSPGIQAICGPQKELVWDRKRRKARGGLFVWTIELIVNGRLAGEASAAAVSARSRRTERKGPIKSTKC